jgi:hypothetical protein
MTSVFDIDGGDRSRLVERPAYTYGRYSRVARPRECPYIAYRLSIRVSICIFVLVKQVNWVPWLSFPVCPTSDPSRRTCQANLRPKDNFMQIDLHMLRLHQDVVCRWRSVACTADKCLGRDREAHTFLSLSHTLPCLRLSLSHTLCLVLCLCLLSNVWASMSLSLWHTVSLSLSLSPLGHAPAAVN